VSADVARAYWSLVRARLRDQVCEACGASLSDGVLVSAGDGTTLQEYGLSDTSAAQLLAATEVLTVRCDRCNTEATIGDAPLHRPEVRSLSAGDLAPWNPRAADLYRSIVRMRLADRVCPTCSAPFRDAVIESAAGGAILPEFDLDDEAALSLIAWTQCLKVRCEACGAEAMV